MIPQECERLADVDYLIAVSRHAAREKAIGVQAAALSLVREAR